MTKTEIFINKAIQVHGNKYDYSKVNYIDCNTKVCIICPEHGEFWQSPRCHLRGRGCSLCSKNKKLTTEEFIKRAKEIHSDKYDYSKVNYVNGYTKVCIICPEHGEFWQEPHEHLRGGGCPICKDSKLEKEIRKFLIKNKIEFEEQKTFDWLKYKSNLFLDFYLPKYNAAIECQGRQHFDNSDDYFGGEKNISEILSRDNIKLEKCSEHGIKIYYYSKLGIEYPYDVFEDKNELLITILRND